MVGDYYAALLGQQQAMNAYQGQLGGLNQSQCAQMQTSSKPEVKKMATDNEAIPDVSLIRVAKWAIVLFLAMALGQRFWDMFGARITSNLHKAIGGPNPP